VSRYEYGRRRLTHYSYYFRNRRVNEAALATSRPLLNRLLASPGGVHVAVSGGPMSGFVVNEDAVFRTLYDGRSMVIDEHWLADAELVIVRTTRWGSVERTLTIPGFTLPEAPK